MDCVVKGALVDFVVWGVIVTQCFNVNFAYINAYQRVTKEVDVVFHRILLPHLDNKMRLNVDPHLVTLSMPYMYSQNSKAVHFLRLTVI